MTLDFLSQGFYNGRNEKVMKVDRHHDPVMELESRLLSELDFIAQQLRGKITQSVYVSSNGKQSKKVTIEYDVRDKNEDTI